MIYVGIDNGVSGAIAFYFQDKMQVYSLPLKKVQSYTKTLKLINKIDFVELKKIFLSLKEKNEQIKVLWERPFCNPMAWNATLLSMLAYQTTLDVLEELEISYDMVDSKQWQSVLLPKGIYKTTTDKSGRNRLKADKKVLKQASLSVANRIYPYLKLKKDGESDAVLICEYLRKKELGEVK